jgi:hypothetical protein
MEHVKSLRRTKAVFPTPAVPDSKVDSLVLRWHIYQVLCHQLFVILDSSQRATPVQGSACEQSYEVAFMQNICAPVNRLVRYEAHLQQNATSVLQWQTQKRGTITDSQVMAKIQF